MEKSRFVHAGFFSESRWLHQQALTMCLLMHGLAHECLTEML